MVVPHKKNQRIKIGQPSKTLSYLDLRIDNLESQVFLTKQKLPLIQNQVTTLAKNLDYIQALGLVKENRTLTQKLAELEKSHQELHHKIDKLTNIILEQKILIKEINKIVHA